MQSSDLTGILQFLRAAEALKTVSRSGWTSAGGLTSGIDLALHVVHRFFGEPAAERTAAYMEHRSREWLTTAASS